MASQMTKDEWHAFVSEGTRTGKVATTRADGRPHVAPVWFILDGDDLVFTTGAHSIKGRTLQRTGQVAVCVDDERAPYSFALVEGTVAISDDLDELLTYATRIAARYIGEEQAEEYGRRNAVVGELVVRVTPSHVRAVAGVAE